MSLSRDWYASVFPHEWTLAHYRDALGHAVTVPSIGNSLRYAGLATGLDLFVGLAEEAIPVGLVCPPKRDCGSWLTTAEEIIGHPIFRLPFMGPVNTWLLTERLVRFKPTVLHCLCESKASITRQLAHRLDIPYVLTVNSLQKRWNSLSISSTYCAKIIVPTPTVAKNVIRMHSRFADRIEQINVGAVAMDTVTCFSKSSRTARS